MENELKRKPWCSVTANAVERDQIDGAAKVDGKRRSVWIRETLVNVAKRTLQKKGQK